MICEDGQGGDFAERGGVVKEKPARDCTVCVTRVGFLSVSISASSAVLLHHALFGGASLNSEIVSTPTCNRSAIWIRAGESDCRLMEG